jgi:hypothetical protein
MSLSGLHSFRDGSSQRHFFTDQSGVIRQTTNGSAAPATSTPNPNTSFHNFD